MPVIAAAKNKGNPPTGRQWRTPEIISANIEESAFYGSTDISVDASGNVIAVWEHLYDIPNSTDQRAVLWTNRYVAGRGWGTAEMLSDSTRYSAYTQVASDASGNAIAVGRLGNRGQHLCQTLCSWKRLEYRADHLWPYNHYA
ncbi:MAG: hypothetical protein ACTFAL_04465 [Candidatus Electronema sp. V4]|uniref:hypothetical protein n=1 Tax=Candidatus Electronema sp. V4 TaxID=3454756 RepID=UPI004055423F